MNPQEPPNNQLSDPRPPAPNPTMAPNPSPVSDTTPFPVQSTLLYFVKSAAKAAEPVSGQVVDSIQAKDSNAVYAIASDEFKANTSKAEIDNELGRVSAALQGNEKLTSRYIANKNGRKFAEFIYTIDTMSGTKYIRTTLVEKDGAWLLYNFRSSDTQLEPTIN